MTNRNRAAWLQAFHTGVSESQRQENIKTSAVTEKDSANSQDTKSAPRNTGYGKPRQGKTVTEKQAALILSLLSQKDTTDLKILHGQTVDPANIGDMEIGRGSALIEKLFACPNKASDSTKITNQGSEKQKQFLTSLMTQLNLTESDINEWGYKSISDAISHLLQMTKVVKPQVSIEDLTGVWTDGTRVIRAYNNQQKTRVLAKEWNNGEFTYLGMAERFVKGMRKMTLEEAKQFGKTTLTCCVCGIELTDPESQDKGIGPVCESKF